MDGLTNCRHSVLDGGRHLVRQLDDVIVSCSEAEARVLLRSIRGEELIRAAERRRVRYPLLEMAERRSHS